jgi:hypothetical protein
MRALACGLLAVGWLVALLAPARGDDQADMKALVDKAIKAAGGEANVAKLKAVTWKTKGKFYIDNKTINFTTEGALQGLDRGRLDLVAEVDNQTHNFCLVIDGNKAWFKGDNKVEAAPREILAMLKADLYAIRLAQLLKPLKDKGCTLSALGELNINDRPAVGIKATRKGYPEVDVFFDKQTGLPIKCQVQVTERKGGGETTAHEFYFGAARKADGLVHFTKVSLKRADKLTFEVELSDVKTEDAIEASRFGKPD